MNIIRRYIKTRREILVNEDMVQKALVVLNDHGIFTNLSISNCGWAKAPDCWFIHCDASEETWVSVLEDFVKDGVKILPETTGY